MSRWALLSIALCFAVGCGDDRARQEPKLWAEFRMSFVVEDTDRPQEVGATKTTQTRRQDFRLIVPGTSSADAETANDQGLTGTLAFDDLRILKNQVSFTTWRADTSWEWSGGFVQMPVGPFSTTRHEPLTMVVGEIIRNGDGGLHAKLAPPEPERWVRRTAELELIRIHEAPSDPGTVPDRYRE